MPAGLFNDSDFNQLVNGNPLEENRALQLALELSMLGLINEDDNNNHESDSRAKKSQNTTECVPVPSSEHVAEIVGRQGCKIKALRAKTNTYIKTPVRGEEPVFVVTGRKEDVNAAKKEILSAAEHFSQIRAQRKGNLNGNGVGGPGPTANVPGQMTIQVRVPYKVVGLVVGPKGATIKRIQQDTNTYIITPSREKEPIFEVTGLKDNVLRARNEIEAHIAIRTGGVIDSTTGIASSASNSSSGDSEASSHEYSNDSPLMNSFVPATSIASFYKLDNDPFTAFSTASSRDNIITSSRTQDIFSFNLNHSSLTKDFTSSPPTTNGSKFGDIYSSLNTTLSTPIINNNDSNYIINSDANSSSLITTTNNSSSSTSPTNTTLNNCNGLDTFNGNTTLISNNATTVSGSCEKDEGIGESPTFDSVGAAVGTTSTSLWPDFGSFPIA